ncbi:MAG: Nif3-like dinuclear metal center hexameric protein [Clostridia bacterium]|nr:Nif3-like dinuclear metal center hexameric protein [Clostridia bacterium]
MKAFEIYNKLCSIAPIELAMDYDNPGFLVGDKSSDINVAVVCLDVTSAVVDFAVKNGAKLIISHHPIIFEPLKSITADDNKRVFSCLSAGISVISMHTNLDVAKGGVNDQLASALSLSFVESITDCDGFTFKMGKLPEEMNAHRLAEHIKNKLGGVVRYTDNKKSISKVAVCGGSGSDFLKLAAGMGADALVTADVKHKYFIEAAEMGFNLFDAGHFHTEDVIVEPLTNSLNSELSGVTFIPYHLKEINTL